MNKKNLVEKFIREQKKAISFKEICASLIFLDKKEIKKVLDELKLDALVVENNKGKFMSPFLCGFTPAKIISYSQGFLFARPLFSEGDIYVPIEKSKDAIVNDIVMINRIKNTEKGLSGVVERIVKTGDRTLIGSISVDRKKVNFIADDKYRCEIPVNKKFTKGARDKDKVQIEIKILKGKISAKVLKIYGKSTCAKVCADAVIDKNDIATKFSQKALDEALKISKKGIRKRDLENRLDMRNEKVFTIDGEDAKDLDDAISIEKKESGYRLGVHIADVSHYIKYNSALDREANDRGTSVYFADRVIPMYPKKISNGICSLNAGKDRLTLSAFINLDNEGNILSYEFKKTVINSKVRGVYSEINSILNNRASKALKEKYKDVLEEIKLAKELSNILEKKTSKRGKLNLESDEAKFSLDEKGICIDVKLRDRGISERIIENFMILANECAANLARTKNIPFVYRVHESPNPERIVNLSKFLTILGFKLPKVALERPKSRHFVRLLNQSKKTEYYNLISNQVLRAMSKARYFEKPLGHFGLSIDDYCHFTSPIRRYPDTTVHRILSDLIDQKENENLNSKYKDLTIQVAKDSSIAEVIAVKAEREAEKYYMAEYMNSQIGKKFEGQISGIIQKGIFVKLQNTVEGFVNLENSKSKDGNFVFDGMMSTKNKKTGKIFRIGDKVKVSVDTVNISQGEIEFKLCK